MKSATIKNKMLTVLALLLVIPAAYFILVNVLNELGIAGPYNAVAPLVERMGGREPLGWNINLLIAFGPVVAFLLAILQVLKIEWEFTREDFRFHFTIRKRWFPILTGAFSLSLLAILSIYLFGENCNCH
jgi:hypothetical protein